MKFQNKFLWPKFEEKNTFLKRKNIQKRNVNIITMKRADFQKIRGNKKNKHSKYTYKPKISLKKINDAHN